MRNQPGISWGFSTPVNLMRSSKGWLAFYCHPDGRREIIKIFNLSNTCYPKYRYMLEQLATWNYGTCELCPQVKAALDWG